MAEYINKADVKKEIIRFSTGEGSNTVCSQLYCNIGNMPIIDIVHCSECVHSKRLTAFCMVCELLYEWEDSDYKEVKPNWYCADGERSAE